MARKRIVLFFRMGTAMDKARADFAWVGWLSVRGLECGKNFFLFPPVSVR